MSAVEVAAIVAALLLTIVAGIQVALALGVPWGAYAYGGRVAAENGRLPTGYRVASAVAALLLVAAAWVLLARAGVVSSGTANSDFVAWASWAIVVFMGLNTLSNLAARHPLERWGMGSVTLAVTVLAAVVAASG